MLYESVRKNNNLQFLNFPPLFCYKTIENCKKKNVLYIVLKTKLIILVILLQ